MKQRLRDFFNFWVIYSLTEFKVYLKCDTENSWRKWKNEPWKGKSEMVFEVADSALCRRSLRTIVSLHVHQVHLKQLFKIGFIGACDGASSNWHTLLTQPDWNSNKLWIMYCGLWHLLWSHLVLFLKVCFDSKAKVPQIKVHSIKN